MRYLRATVLCLAACGSGGGFPDASQVVDGFPSGAMLADWSLVRQSDGSDLDCFDVGDSVSVTLLMRNYALQGGFTEAFNCSTLMGTTRQLPIGKYDVNFELNGVGLIATSPEQRGITVSLGKVAILGSLVFTVDAVGMIDLRVDSLKPTGNCATVASGGAGITRTRITLNHSVGGACEPATIMVGGSPYTINCGSPVNIGCIEKTTPITGTLPSSNYQIHVRGDQGGAQNCYKNDDTIRVPPNNGTLTRTLIFLRQSGGGCM